MVDTSGQGATSHQPADGKPAGSHPQDFIFWRELAEVYLLLDFVSGRSDKNLTTAFTDAGPPPGLPKDEVPSDTKLLGHEWIKQICKIGWPPDGSKVELDAQATTLLMAKDVLNFAAKPANGATIAFSILVAGDDEIRAEHHLQRRSRIRRWLGLDRTSAHSSPEEKETNRVPAKGWGGELPSRASLARLAYPGLVATASRVASKINAGFVLLFIWLFVTCLLSWNVTVGHALVTRLDGLETNRQAIVKKLIVASADERRPAPPAGTAGSGAAADASGAPSPPPPPAAGSGAPAGTTGAPPPPPAATGAAGATGGSALPTAGAITGHAHCESYLREYNPALAETLKQYREVSTREIVCELGENRFQYKVARENLADWLVPWDWSRAIVHKLCSWEGRGQGRCLAKEEAVKSITATNDLWAATLLEVLAAAVLPFCYGFLGAGAAVVRNIWAKMRDSLLAPRDLRLAYGQLALGAVIGASIGLFVTSPSSSAQAGTSLFTGPVALSASALSFIAGFGVEGIFVALESLIKRIFNLK